MAGFFKSLIARFTGSAFDWDELEAALIAGDLGPRMATQIVDDLKKQGRTLSSVDIVQAARSRIAEILPPPQPPIMPPGDKPHVILVVGVNGTGKTTSTAKLANHLKKKGRAVIVAAADTFRAAAVEQLEVWSRRLDIPLVKGPPNCDPAAVCFDAYDLAARQKADYLIVDTAGRLHTKHNLMEELKKVHRTLGKRDPASPHETLIVVDATTGMNALQQAREFNKAIPLSGLIVTKLDGSGKGGVLVAIQHELGIPARYVGLGEGVDDFEAFHPDKFVGELL